MPERFEIYIVYKRRYINTLLFLYPFNNEISKALRMARVKKITQFYVPPSRLSTNEMSDPAFTPSHRASPHFGRYLLFVPQGRRLSWAGWLSTVPQRVGGLVGLGGWLNIKVECPPVNGHLSQYQPTDSAAAGDRTHDH